MTFFAEPLVVLLGELYGFKNPQLVQMLDRGRSADNFVISDTGSKYFVKIYNPKRTKEKIVEIQTVEQFFFSHGVPAVAPITHSRGEAVFEYEGKYFAVFPYIIGRELSTLPSEKAIRSIGSTLARLHLASKDEHSLSLTKKMDRWTKGNFLQKAEEILAIIEKQPTKGAFDMLAKESLELKVKLATENPTTFESLEFTDDAILHGDYHYHNMFFNADDELSHVFDFERTMRGSRAAELGYGLFFNCFDLNVETPDEVEEVHYARARAYLAAYNEIYPLAPTEIARGIRWYYLSQMVHLPWPERIHYLDGDMRCDSLLPKRFSRLKFISKNLDSILALAEAE